MKKTILLVLIALLSAFISRAQTGSNLVVFTENGEQFTVILNGVRQNAQAETNVKITNLIAPSYKVKIIFADTKLGEFDKTIYVNPGNEFTYVIKKNNKGEYIMRYMNEVPLAQAAPVSTGQSVSTYSSTPPPATTTTKVTHTQTSTVGGNNAPQNGNVSMGVNINDPELGVNFNMNVSGTGTTSQTSSSTTTTTYTTTTTTSDDFAEPEEYQQEPKKQKVYSMPGYSGAVGCPWPLSPQDFAGVKQSISSKSFDDSKLTIAKQVINSNCLLCSQVKEIMLLFSFEDTRLELAKFAYGHTFDIGNYYKLNDAFTFESSIEELNEFIGGRK